MRRAIVIYAGLLAAATAVAETGTLKIRVTGFENQKGRVYVQLDNAAASFDGDAESANAYRKTNEKIRSDLTVDLSFNHLPFGVYAVRLFHDENGNGKLDSNFLGIPIEAYGFSNNARSTVGPAPFEDAKFIFSKNDQSISIHAK